MVPGWIAKTPWPLSGRRYVSLNISVYRGSCRKSSSRSNLSAKEQSSSLRTYNNNNYIYFSPVQCNNYMHNTYINARKTQNTNRNLNDSKIQPIFRPIIIIILSIINPRTGSFDVYYDRTWCLRVIVISVTGEGICIPKHCSTCARKMTNV